MTARPYLVSVNYHQRDDVRYGLAHRAYFVHDLPRLIPLCRLLGHRPVVDGYGIPGAYTGHVARWVCCDRCGVRPHPQGNLDPQQWNIGDPYPMSFGNPMPAEGRELCRLQEGYRDPGAWPPSPTGALGVEVVVGRNIGGAQLSIKVGNGGSEHTLAAHARLPWVGSLHLHTEAFGTWLQRRLNPVDLESKVIEVSVDFGRLWWRLWADRDGGGGKQRWRDGSVRVDPRDLLLGEYRYANVGAG